MKPVTWDRVKLNAQRCANVNGTYDAAYALLAGIEDGTFDWRGNLEKLQEAVWERIERWDIRCIRKLHELFPTCLPRDCKYAVDMLDDGTWWVVA